jgi:uroporphyrinogen decarboxylase
LTNRERVGAAFAHKQPDRTPVSVGTTIVDGMTRFALNRYEEYLGREVTKPLVTSRIMQTAAVPEWIWDDLGMEFRPVRHVNSLTPDTTFLQDGSYIDCFGITWKKSEMYFDPVEGPWFGEVSDAQIRHQRWIDPGHAAAYYREGARREECLRLKEAGYVVVADLVSFGTFEQAAWMRGFSDLLIGLYEDPKLTATIFDKTTETALGMFDAQLSAIGDLIDVVCHGDDMGMQDRAFFSVDVYKKYIQKHHRRVIDLIKSKTRAKVFLHTCGSVHELIPSLIEVGVDILNPIQTTARNMQPELLKREFGKDIVFWGGIDTQRTLQNGSDEQIRDEIRRLVDVLGKDGGYVLAPSHNLQSALEPRKVGVLFQALNEIR